MPSDNQNRHRYRLLKPMSNFNTPAMYPPKHRNTDRYDHQQNGFTYQQIPPAVAPALSATNPTQYPVWLGNSCNINRITTLMNSDEAKCYPGKMPCACGQYWVTPGFICDHYWTGIRIITAAEIEQYFGAEVAAAIQPVAVTHLRPQPFLPPLMQGFIPQGYPVRAPSEVPWQYVSDPVPVPSVQPIGKDATILMDSASSLIEKREEHPQTFATTQDQS